MKFIAPQGKAALVSAFSKVMKKIFCTGLTRPAKAEQKSLVPARQAQQTNQE
jgi:hypothetical protein